MALAISGCSVKANMAANPHVQATVAPTGDYIYLNIFTPQVIPPANGYTSTVTFTQGSTTPSAALAVTSTAGLPQGIPAPSGSNAPGTAQILQAGTVLYAVTGIPTQSATDIPTGSTFTVTPPTTIPYTQIAIAAYVPGTSSWYLLTTGSTSGTSAVNLSTANDFSATLPGEIVFATFGLPSV
jgi:hypothetical protein